MADVRLVRHCRWAISSYSVCSYSISNYSGCFGEALASSLRF